MVRRAQSSGPTIMGVGRLLVGAQHDPGKGREDGDLYFGGRVGTRGAHGRPIMSCGVYSRKSIRTITREMVT